MAVVFSSCDNSDDDEAKGYVAFDANYDIVNCVSSVAIYIDDVSVGILEKPTDTCQRLLMLVLNNYKVCCAVVSKEISFNIEDLQINDNDKVTLNISGESITYEY